MVLWQLSVFFILKYSKHQMMKMEISLNSHQKQKDADDDEERWLGGKKRFEKTLKTCAFPFIFPQHKFDKLIFFIFFSPFLFLNISIQLPPFLLSYAWYLITLNWCHGNVIMEILWDKCDWWLRREMIELFEHKREKWEEKNSNQPEIIDFLMLLAFYAENRGLKFSVWGEKFEHPFPFVFFLVWRWISITNHWISFFSSFSFLLKLMDPFFKVNCRFQFYGEYFFIPYILKIFNIFLYTTFNFQLHFQSRKKNIMMKRKSKFFAILLNVISTIDRVEFWLNFKHFTF